MSVSVVYPSATLLGLTWLRSQLAGVHGSAVPVSGKVPTPRPLGGFVVIRRAGGIPDAAYRDRPRLDAQCWHDDEAKAERLAADVLAVLLAARGHSVSGVTIGATSTFLGVAAVPDPDSAQARYLLSVEWQVPGVMLAL